MGLPVPSNKEKTVFTAAELKKMFPQKKNTITDKVVDLINEANANPDFNGDEFIDSMVDLQSVLMDCKASMPEYINALKFCTALQTGSGTAIEAYKIARRNDKFVQDRINAKSGTPEYKALSNAAGRYRTSKLVQKILTQVEMPLYLMFQKQRYEAIKVLATEMDTAKYARDRINAADKLLHHAAPPEGAKKIEIDIGIAENTALDDLNAQLMQIASTQKEQLESGTISLGEVGALSLKTDEEEIIDGEVE